MPTKCLKQDCTSSGFADKPFLFYKITSVSPDIHPLHRKMTTCIAFYPPVLHFTPCKFTKMHCGIAFFIWDVHNKKCNSTISFLPHNLAPVWRVFTHNCYDKGILTLVFASRAGHIGQCSVNACYFCTLSSSFLSGGVALLRQRNTCTSICKQNGWNKSVLSQWGLFLQIVTIVACMEIGLLWWTRET